MIAKEDLQRKIQGLNAQLAAAIGSLNAIIVSEYELKPGMVVDHFYNRGSILTVSRVSMSYGKPKAWGRKTLKNGKLGEQEFEIYGTYKVIPAATSSPVVKTGGQE